MTELYKDLKDAVGFGRRGRVGIFKSDWTDDQDAHGLTPAWIDGSLTAANQNGVKRVEITPN